MVAPRLIVLAKNILVGEFGSPVSDILKKIEATLGSGAIEAAAFDNPHKDLSAQFEPEQKTRIQQEQQVRVIMNALIM
ncbi:hypothetical protein KBC03_07005 [Patescibacteria group bacterium]|nr:hypothetical protein [Patescibacteria group bacterium]